MPDTHALEFKTFPMMVELTILAAVAATLLAVSPNKIAMGRGGASQSRGGWADLKTK